MIIQRTIVMVESVCAYLCVHGRGAVTLALARSDGFTYSSTEEPLTPAQRLVTACAIDTFVHSGAAAAVVVAPRRRRRRHISARRIDFTTTRR